MWTNCNLDYSLKLKTLVFTLLNVKNLKMENKNFFLVISLLLAFVGRSSTSDPSAISEHSKAKPVYKCTMEGTKCTFSGVNLNSTHYEWQPTADDPNMVTAVTFRSSKFPVATKDLCETFPALTSINFREIGIEEIKEDAFHACNELTELILDRNKIKEIPETTFLHTKNLIYLDVGYNDLREFPLELLKENKKLSDLIAWGNDFSDIEAEQIVDFLPSLEKFAVDNNEIACTRMVEIIQMLKAKEINTPAWNYDKTRYYPQERLGIIDNWYMCNPDLSWMASNYRKENHQIALIDEQLETQELVTEQRLSELGDHFDQEMLKINRWFDQLETKIDSLVKLVAKAE